MGMILIYFLEKHTVLYMLGLGKVAWQKKWEARIEIYEFRPISNRWEGSQGDIAPIYKLYPNYSLPEHVKRLEMETLHGCPLLSSAVDLNHEGFKGSTVHTHLCW